MFDHIATAHVPSAHEQLLAKLLKDYYMGELCPPESVLRCMYDREFYEAGLNPSTIYRDQRDVVECIVIPCVLGDEPLLAACVTSYLPWYKSFSSRIEYWPLSVVEKFTIII